MENREYKKKECGPWGPGAQGTNLSDFSILYRVFQYDYYVNMIYRYALYTVNSNKEGI